MSPTKTDPDLCGCGATITSDAAWKRHVDADGCTLAGWPGTSTHPNVAREER